MPFAADGTEENLKGRIVGGFWEVFRSSEEVKAKECSNFEASKILIWLLKLQMESRVVLCKMCNQ